MSSDDEDSKPHHKLASIFKSSENSTDVGSNITSSLPDFTTPITSIRGSPNKSLSNKSIGINPSSSSDNTIGNKAALKLIVVKVVQSFLFKEGNYVPYGKLAAALLGNSDIKHYQIILYKTKKDHITRSYITNNYWFGVQKNNYVSFYDYQDVIWTIMFETEPDFVEFCSEVTIAKWICSANKDQTIVQDVINSSHGKNIKQSDTVKINYRVSPLDDHGLVKDYSSGSESFVFSLKYDWENHLIGITENTRKFFVLPPTNMGFWEDKVGKSCKNGLFLDLTVVICDTNQNLMSLSNIELVLPKLPSNDDEDEKSKTPIKEKIARSHDSADEFENKSVKKSDLITRMGRLGKATLPLKVGRVLSSAADSDDTEEDTSSTQSDPSQASVNKTKQQRIKTKTLQSNPINLQQQQQIYQLQQVVPSYSQQQIVSNTAIGYPSSVTSFTPVAISPIIDNQLPILFSEHRTHNSEIRMGLNRVTDKVDKVVEKIKTGPIFTVLEKLETMEKEVEKKFSLLEEQNIEINEILSKNECEDTEKENLDADKMKDFQKENDKLLDSLVESKALIEEIQVKISKLEADNTKLENQLTDEIKKTELARKEQLNILKELQNELIDPVLLREHTETSLNNWTSMLSTLEQSINDINYKFSNSQQGNQSSTLEREDDSARITEKMNGLYKILKSQFKPNTNYTSVNVHKTFDNIFKAYC